MLQQYIYYTPYSNSLPFIPPHYPNTSVPPCKARGKLKDKEVIIDGFGWRPGMPRVGLGRSWVRVRWWRGGSWAVWAVIIPEYWFIVWRCRLSWRRNHSCRRSRQRTSQPPSLWQSAICINGTVPVNAVVVQHKSLDGFLQTVNVDECEHEDGVGTVGELEDSFVGGEVLLR